MAPRTPTDLSELGRALHDVFARYSDPGTSFCGYCYTTDEMRRITASSIPALSPDDARTLLWECWDHWESADVYRHYLPRILEVLGPPDLEEDLYAGHVLETLASLGFQDWPEAERHAVLDFLEAVGPHCNHNDRDRHMWSAALDGLRIP